MSEHTTEETLMYLRQCLLPGNVQDGIDLEVPSWLVRDAVAILAKLSKMEEERDHLRDMLKGAEEYASEGWDWVSELCERLQVEDVFEAREKHPLPDEALAGGEEA